MNNDSSAVIATQFSNPTSPPVGDEVKISFDLEIKVPERDGETIVKQLLANMMVVAAMSLQEVCSKSDCYKFLQMKSMTTYELAMDLNTALQTTSYCRQAIQIDALHYL